jgi:L-threonylcarbamoyladenylate synthase
MVSSQAAVRAVFEAKGRSVRQPLTVQVASIDEIAALVREIPPDARLLIERFMPGPLTLVLRSGGMLSDEITAGTGKVGVRVPDHPVACAILREIHQPLVVTSANRHGHAAAISAQEVSAQLEGRIDLLLDGGECRLGAESTVLDVTCDPPVLLRVGALPREMIEGVIGRVSGSAMPVSSSTL